MVCNISGDTGIIIEFSADDIIAEIKAQRNTAM